MRPTNLNVNWSQLTHLELDAPDRSWRYATIMRMSTASEILQVSTRLVYCRIRIAGWADSSPSHIHSMQLPHLRHLAIGLESYILPFTDRLQVPGLQEINLHIIENNVTGNNVDYKTSLAPLFHPQQGSIHKLIIDTRYLHHESFLDILRKCPALTSLTATQVQHDFELLTRRPRENPRITIDDEFLERISSNNGEGLCSQLEEFICEYSAAFSTTGMIEFIKRKQDGDIPGLAKLKKVALLSYSPLEEKCVLSDELRPYISQGLALHLDTPGDRNSFDNEVYGNSAACYPDSWELY
jgi:hypothetical protein